MTLKETSHIVSSRFVKPEKSAERIQTLMYKPNKTFITFELPMYYSDKNTYLNNLPNSIQQILISREIQFNRIPASGDENDAILVNIDL